LHHKLILQQPTTKANKQKNKQQTMKVLACLLFAFFAVSLCQLNIDPMGDLSKFNLFLDGFHLHNGDLCSQVEARHYCNRFSDKLTQCIIMNANATKLMGVEYVITNDTFMSLPEDEKRLWHSHVFEMQSGQVITTNMTREEELALVAELSSTYGKTWHTFHDGLDLPLGLPMLMMSFTADGQINPDLIMQRDQRFGMDTNAEKEERMNITYPPVLRGADAWTRGYLVQVVVEPVCREQDILWSDCAAPINFTLGMGL